MSTDEMLDNMRNMSLQDKIEEQVLERLSGQSFKDRRGYRLALTNAFSEILQDLNIVWEDLKHADQDKLEYNDIQIGDEDE